MRQRNSPQNREKSIIPLRRSPRFLQQSQPEPEYPKTPNPIQKRNRVLHSDLTPLSSTPDEVSLNKYSKLKRGQIPDRAKESNFPCKGSTGPRRSTRLRRGAEDFLCVRRSPRFSQKGNVEKIGCAEEFRLVRRSPRFSQNGNIEKIDTDESKHEGSSDGSKTSRRVELSRKPLNAAEKRLTRNSVGGRNNGDLTYKNKGCNGFTKSILIEDSRADCISDTGQVKAGINSSEQCMYKIEKRVTRSASRGIKDEKNSKIGDLKDSKSIHHVSVGCSDEKVLSNKGKAELAANLPIKSTRKSKGETTSVSSADLLTARDRRSDVQAEKKEIGANRKRMQVEEGHVVLQGWTMEQELALESAYFAAKPTPHFWKKVAKMVPGKSAQECFDKIHSEILTPQPHKQSRAKGAEGSFLFSASKLLNASEPKTKRPRQSKLKSHLSHKTVRQLLQRQYNSDQDNEADLFSILEPALDPATHFVQDGRLCSTPERNRVGPVVNKRCLERSSSAHRKHLSRLNDPCGATLVSPLVLKKIKNKALHEKYIDQLHSREAKRNAVALRAKKCIKGKSDAKENNTQKSAAVKDAKDALVFCARDAIDHFRHLENSKVNNFDNTSHDFTDSSEEEIEDGS